MLIQALTGRWGLEDPTPKQLHVASRPVIVIVEPAQSVVEEAGAVRHRMADHITLGDAVFALQPPHERLPGTHLLRAPENIARALHFNKRNPDRLIIEADNVATHHVQGSELIDRAVLRDHEVSTRARLFLLRPGVAGGS